MGNAINALDQVDSVINSISNNFSNLFSMFGESSESLVEYYIFRDFKEDQFGMLKKIFTEIDTNKDNFLSREEFSNFLSNQQCLQISSERIENLVCFLSILSIFYKQVILF
jgi:Ca2+-binding EF-hand superfamily protein